MHSRVLFVLLLLLSATATPAAERWLRATTANFELYTTAGERQARDTLRQFEQVRSFYLQASRTKAFADARVRLILFRTAKEYQPFQPGAGAAAYYFNGPMRDYIVLGNNSASSFPIAIHEYTHLVVKHTGWHMPAWLNEGWAELHSTLEPRGKQVLVGNLIPGRMMQLHQDKWMDLATLTEVDHRSPYYNERNKVGMFYSQSWALTHMLLLSPEYRPQFSPFLVSLLNKTPAAAAFQKAYGKSLEQVHKDLQKYVRGTRFQGELHDVKLEKSAEEPVIEPIDAPEGELVLADLASFQLEGDARTRYEKLAQQLPNRAEVPQGLGYLEWRQGNREAARRHFTRAVELGSQDAKLHYDLANLLQETGVETATSIKLLRKALELQPEYPNAHEFLGYVLLNAKRFGEALVEFHAIKNVKPDRAFSYFTNVAHAAAELNGFAEAETAIGRAEKYAESPTEQDRIAQLRRYLEYKQQAARKPAPEAPVAVAQARPGGAASSMRDAVRDGDASPEGRPKLVRREAQTSNFTTKVGDNLREHHETESQRLEGILLKVECAKNNQAALHLNASGKTVSVLIEDPAAVEIRNHTGVSFDFTCGPQKPRRLAVEFSPAQKGTHAGVVRVIEFQ